MPLRLELLGRQVAKRRVDALDVVDRVDEVPDLLAGLGEVLVVGEIDLLFFDGAHEAFGVTVLAWLADRGHAESDAEFLQALDIHGGGILHALIGVMDLRCSADQGPLQGGEREPLIEVAAQVPAADRTREEHP